MKTIIETDEALEMYVAHPEIYYMDEKYIFGYGGRGGGKSKSFARFLVNYALEYPGLVELVTRKAMSSLRITAMKDFLAVCDEMGVNGYMHESQPAEYRFANGSVTHFAPLFLSDKGKNERLKSLDLNIVWFEEPPECQKQDITEILPNLRLPGVRKAFFSFNPPATSEHWIYELYDMFSQQGKAAKVHFALDDNPALPQDVKDELMAYKDQDKGYYLRYAVGEWGIDVVEDRIWKNIVAGKFEGVPDNPFVGIDFGWVHPSSAHLYNLTRDKIYVMDEVFGSYIKDRDFGDMIVKMVEDNGLNPRHVPSFADSADPEGIDDLEDAGVNVEPVEKYAGSVSDSIKHIRKFQIVIDIDKCPHAYEQDRAYQNKTDRNGKPIEDTPVKANDDAPDDMRYMGLGTKDYVKPFCHVG